MSTAIALPGAANGLTGNGRPPPWRRDLNGDGIPDLVTATPVGITVLLGQPLAANHTTNYTVALHGIYNGGPGPVECDAGRLQRRRLGEGNRNFATPAVLTLSRNFYVLAMSDVDGDGRPDLVLSDGNLIAVLYNRATGPSAGSSTS